MYHSLLLTCSAPMHTSRMLYLCFVINYYLLLVSELSFHHQVLFISKSSFRSCQSYLQNHHHLLVVQAFCSRPPLKFSLAGLVEMMTVVRTSSTASMSNILVSISQWPKFSTLFPLMKHCNLGMIEDAIP